MTDWADVGDRWPGRAAAVARFIDAGSRVLDLGAGAQGLRAVLPPDCTYTPADLVLRTPDTLPFDMDQGTWPDGRWDVAVMAGVLEYAGHPDQVLHRLRRVAPVALVTYQHGGALYGSLRSPVSAGAFRAMASRAGWRTDRVGTWRVAEVRKQLIWRLACG